MGTTKVVTWFKPDAFDITARYTSPASLVPGTPLDLGVYRVHVPKLEEPKKVKVRAKVDQHGLFTIDLANLVEEEAAYAMHLAHTFFYGLKCGDLCPSRR